MHDLAARAEGSEDLAVVATMSADERAAWAKAELASIESPIPQTQHDYLSLFAEDPLTAPDLPRQSDLAPSRAPDLVEVVASRAYDADRHVLLRRAVALKSAGRDADADRVSRYLQLLEHLPQLDGEGSKPYAPAVFTRYRRAERAGEKAMPDDPIETERKSAEEKNKDAVEARCVAHDIALLWRLQVRALVAERDAIMRGRDPQNDQAEKRSDAAADQDRAADERAKSNPKKADENLPATGRDVAEARRRALERRLAALRARNAARADRLRALHRRAAGNTVANLVAADPALLARFNGDASVETIQSAQHRIKSGKDYPDIQGLKFCEAYAACAGKGDTECPNKKRPVRFPNCFDETPAIRFGDDIELMGVAELVRVDETFIKYSEAEISYVENILSGETRLREERSTRDFETIEERFDGETTTTRQEMQTTSESELRKEVSTQLATRFNTDVSASASGSGGGTIGVVNFEGEGSLDAGFGLGVDSAIATSTGSTFANEIVETSAEEVARTVENRRTTRSRTLFEKFNRHEIKNDPGAPHRRGIYCFLNKHVCVTETPYGLRWFLRATVALPGRTLICDATTRLAIAMRGTEAPPEFDIGPQDIHPGNYMELAGRYFAQGVSPPPPPLRRLARTYKTDQTNETDVTAEGLEKIGQTLVPVFKSYKRHLVTDTLSIPEGFKLHDVAIAINHGANGVSVPVDMPLKLASAALMTLPVTYSYGILMLPAALWQVLLLASPLMHHNTDSSSVTATVGTEAQESHYYFFEADFLVGEILQMLGTFSNLAPAILAQIEEAAANLTSTLNAQAQAMSSAMQTAVSGVISAITGAFTDIKEALETITDPLSLDIPGLIDALIAAVTTANTTIAGFTSTIPTILFQPFADFISEVSGLIAEAAESSISDLMAALIAASENNDRLEFANSIGSTGEVPVALNVITIKPGVTMTLTGCLLRTNEALDAWRLDTFGVLYQAHLQQVAEYESKRFRGTEQGLTKSPGTMREEENRALREILIHTLNGVKNAPEPQNAYTFDRINLFEHGIDWANMSYRLYNYGPGLREIKHDSLGLLNGIDARRRTFVTATWAQVMLPLSAEPALERAMLAYFENGSTKIGADLTTDELTQLWASVISGRDRLSNAPQPQNPRELVLPTDHIVLIPDDKLPENPDTLCP